MTSLSPVAGAMVESVVGPHTSVRSAEKAPATDATWVPVVTLILWASCVAVGGLGVLLPYDRPQPPPKVDEPVAAELLNVELTNDPLPPPDASPPPASAQPPPLASPSTPSSAPALLAVAEPSPAIAFALPVEGPVQVVEAAQASYARPDPGATNQVGPSTSAQVLTHGRGEGRQPAPEYPLQARRSRQEGTVSVRFRVGTDGRVLEAEATEPSPWPLLNQAAVRVIKDRWQFRPGPARLYVVPIHFQLAN